MGVAGACAGEKEAAGGELRLPLTGEPQTLDPNRAFFANDITLVKSLFRGLLWFDEELNLVPMAAREVPTTANGGISADGVTYTFRLRDNLKWSDGQPLTARDFEYSVKRFLDPRLAAEYASFYYDIKGAEEFNTSKATDEATLARLRDGVGVKAADDRTLAFTLNAPRPTFLQLTALWPIFPVRQDVIDRFGDRWTEAGNLIGNGPFTLQEWVHQSHLVLAPNPNWWGPEKPSVEKLTFRIITDRIQLYNAYLAGELDFAFIPPEQTDAVRNDPTLSTENVIHTELTTFAWQFNNQRAPFNNKLVRQAFSMAVDRDALVQAVFRGVGQPAYSWIPPGMPDHDANLGLEYKLNPTRARELLAQAGFPDGRGLPKVTFTFAQTGTNPLVAQFAQQQFTQSLGIDIDLDAVEPRVFQQRIGENDIQLSLLGWGADYPDPDNWLPELWGCKQRDAASKCIVYAGNNHNLYDNPEFDRLMAQAARELDNVRRLETYAQAQRLLVSDAPVIFTYYRARNLLIKPYVRGFTRTGLDGGTPGDWFYERVSIARG